MPQQAVTIARAFEAQGYRATYLQSTSRPPSRGTSWTDLLLCHIETLDTWLIRIQKPTRRRQTGAEWRRAVGLCAATRDLFGADRAVLILHRHRAEDEKGRWLSTDLAVWSREETATAIQKVFAPRKPEVTTPAPAPSPPPKSHGELIADELRSLPCGKDDAVRYERLVLYLLRYLFRPYLEPIGAQVVSDDNLDRPDILFKLHPGHHFWDVMRAEHQLRILVVECKNYCDPIGQAEVESLQQYLWSHARRTVGLLCCRQRPSRSAITARRRAWVEFGKLILFVSDGMFLEMLAPTRVDISPARILDAQLDEFFGSLSP